MYKLDLKMKAMRDKLENVLCLLRESDHCSLEEKHSLLRRKYPAWPPCCLGDNPPHSWQSRRNYSWISSKGGFKSGFCAQGLPVLDRSQLRRETKASLLPSHLVADGNYTTVYWMPGRMKYSAFICAYPLNHKPVKLVPLLSLLDNEKAGRQNVLTMLSRCPN